MLHKTVLNILIGPALDGLNLGLKPELNFILLKDPI